MGFNTSSVWIKVAFVSLLLGTLLFVIGFATISWMTTDYNRHYDYDRYGLWKFEQCRARSRCTSYKYSSLWLDRMDWEVWFRATQAFECIGLICQVLALLIIFLFVFMDSMRKRSPLIAIIVFAFVAAISMAIGFVIFATKIDDRYQNYYDVGWSMGVAIAGCVLTFIAGVMGVIDLKR